MWRGLLLLFMATAIPVDRPFGSDSDLVRLLDRTVWIDIGPGRQLTSLTPRERADLKRCTQPTMAFQKTGRSWVQSFYAGVEMRTVYVSVALKNDGPAKTAVFYIDVAGKPTPSEKLRINEPGDVLVEQTPGFRAHTFVKCDPPKPVVRMKSRAPDHFP